ncbi:hypothetical protein AB835_14245 [Candidatus Endobugula sertula]|uniref:Uncharacterized protein n=1 Tax=Candidatus Endobugula sertula TaxID=62101 RepID=A0A1D2QLH6_9GAMM|nr:hypothetical protein AB835_14245 [Candidatus Endobugula sertula]
MSKQKCNSAARLRQLKSAHQQFRQSLNERLMAFDDLLYNQQQAYTFYSRAMLALAQEEEEPSLWVIGALVFDRRLRQESENLTHQLQEIRQFAKLH